jgi:hypothetical protein
MHPNRLPRRRAALISLFGALVVLAAPGAASIRAATAADIGVKLVLRPLDQPGSFFDLTMRPGETRSLAVEIGNDGHEALAARTYAADVYTIINGGFGGRLRDEPRTGTTRWLDYAPEVLELSPGEDVHQAFTVAVPADATPGEYITSLILENDAPVSGGGPMVLDQVVRQAVAVVVTVPGLRSPGLRIDDATHTVVAGTSIVSVAVENTGNVRLKPVIAFTLLDPAGAQVSQTSVPMDTFYARTATFVEIPLAALLAPGMYTIRLTLDDAAEGARAEASSIRLVVEAMPDAASDGGIAAGLTDVLASIGDGRISASVRGVALVGLAAVIALGLLGVGVGLALRRRRRTEQRASS